MLEINKRSNIHNIDVNKVIINTSIYLLVSLKYYYIIIVHLGLSEFKILTL